MSGKRLGEIFQPIDPKIMDDPDIAAVGPMGEFAYIRGLLYIRRYMTFGKIPVRAIGEVCDGIPAYKKHVSALVERGLWEESDDKKYYTVRNWEKWNWTKAEIEERTRKRRAAGAKGGRASADAKANRQAGGEQ